MNVAPPLEQAQTTTEIYTMLRYGRKREEVKEDQPPTIAFIRSLLNDTCTLHQPLKAIRNHQFFARSSIDCQLSLSLLYTHTLSLPLSLG